MINSVGVEYFERRPPPDWFDERSVKSGEIDQPVSGQEEVGDEWSDSVQFGDNDTTQGDDERQDVTIDGLVVLAVTTAKGSQIGVEFVFAQSLEHLWCRDQTGQGRAQGSGETTGVNQRTES